MRKIDLTLREEIVNKYLKKDWCRSDKIKTCGNKASQNRNERREQMKKKERRERMERMEWRFWSKFGERKGTEMKGEGILTLV